MSPSKPERLPVRKVDEQWEVLFLAENKWFPCQTKEDALVIAAIPLLEFESLEDERSDLEFADELEKTATTLQRYKMGFGARFFQRRADEVRESCRTN